MDKLVYVHYNMRLRLKHLQMDAKKGEGDYDPTDLAYLRDDEDPIVSWISKTTVERGEYELDEESPDPEDPPRPNTFLASVAKEQEQYGAKDGQEMERSFQVQEPITAENEVNLDDDIILTDFTTRSRERLCIDDSADFDTLMQGPALGSTWVPPP